MPFIAALGEKSLRRQISGGENREDIVEEKYGGEQMIVIEEDIKENGILRSWMKTFYDYFRPSVLGKTWQVRG